VKRRGPVFPSEKSLYETAAFTFGVVFPISARKKRSTRRRRKRRTRTPKTGPHSRTSE